MDWLRRARRWFTKGEPPALVRLRARTGEFIDGPVELRARAEDGRERTWTARAAQGLCTIHFHADKMELELVHAPRDGARRHAAVRLTRDDVAFGFAPVLWMD
jgi:hypothetical protein